MYMVGTGRSGERKVDDLALIERGAGRAGFDEEGPKLATELERCTGAGRTLVPFLGTPPFWVPFEVALFSMEERFRVPLEVAECRKLVRGEAWGAALVYVLVDRCNKSILQKMRNLESAANERECVCRQ